VLLSGGIRAIDTIPVSTDWNLIGSITYPVDISTVSVIGTTISNFYGYNGGYYVASVLRPIEGYWVKAAGNGQIVLSGESRIAKTGQSTEQDNFNTLSVMDKAGNRQTLYFAEGPVESSVLRRFEMPPPAPEPLFDVRFASQRMLEVSEKNESKDCPIRVTSAKYPLRIQWKLVSRAVVAHLVVGGKGTLLKGEESLQIDDPKATIILRLSGSPLPKEFALEQNYPNPFNPKTTIRYALPTQAQVSLKVYNLLGQEIKRLVDEVQEAGYKSVEWSSTNNNGMAVASGVYFYRLQAGDFVQVRKMMVLK
jgi:hypothetical protein